MRNSRADSWSGFLLRAVLTAVVVAAFAAQPAFSGSQGQEVRDAALTTYIHGMTAQIARSEFGPQSVPALLRLLEDPGFPRRDNVVAVLGYLGSHESTNALLRFLNDPVADLSDPNEDRALLLAPQSLGQIASRGDRAALDALLSMTAPGNNGGILARSAARGPRPMALRDDLLQMSLRGLAFSGTAQARGRLDAIAQGRSRPATLGRDLQSGARDALDLHDRFRGVGPTAAPAGPVPTDAPGGAGSAAQAPGGASEGASPEAADANHFNVNNSRLDYANHVNVTDPMTDARLDACLDAASGRIGKSDFGGDVACCAGVQRVGSAQSFGSASDGLDMIDTSAELNSVLNHPVSRFKVVRAINHCGGTGTNIIGCAWVGGDGAAVVRYGSAGTEGLLWAHEYGHNVGLPHNTAGNSFIMWGLLSRNSTGLTQAECDLFHTPVGNTNADLADIGVCSDGDADDVQDLVDSCPGVANNDQLDSDGDGIGDACEDGCGNGIIDDGEECDGGDLGDLTCQELGHDGGNLACSGSCTLDESSCTDCGDGVREGTEECDGADLGGADCSDLSCTGGSASCTASCTFDYAGCSGCPVCDNDGVCETDENCIDCPGDCSAGPGATCGNGVCDAADGEDCVTCAVDCRGEQNGNRSGRYCCGAGGGQVPVDCGNSRCTQGEWECTDLPGAPSCCGDLFCEGIENGFNCELDCGAPPFCGDGSCGGGEDSCSCESDCGLPPVSETFCSDGVDDDCDGTTDCSDAPDCDADPACSQTCNSLGAWCSSNSDCCSTKCRGQSGAKTCK